MDRYHAILAEWLNTPWALRREVLLRLAQQARAEGRASEAELYEMMASAD